MPLKLYSQWVMYYRSLSPSPQECCSAIIKQSCTITAWVRAHKNAAAPLKLMFFTYSDMPLKLMLFTYTYIPEINALYLYLYFSLKLMLFTYSGICCSISVHLRSHDETSDNYQANCPHRPTEMRSPTAAYNHPVMSHHGRGMLQYYWGRWLLAYYDYYWGRWLLVYGCLSIMIITEKDGCLSITEEDSCLPLLLVYYWETWLLAYLVVTS
jgi:hypothetical protein